MDDSALETRESPPDAGIVRDEPEWRKLTKLTQV